MLRTFFYYIQVIFLDYSLSSFEKVSNFEFSDKREGSLGASLVIFGKNSKNLIVKNCPSEGSVGAKFKFRGSKKVNFSKIRGVSED